VEQITGFLRMRSCKFVLIACNSASTVLGKANVPYTDDEILEVISPIVNLIAQQDKYHHIGVIGTRKTILSGMFDRQLHKLNPDLEIVSRATPLLVSMIEEGFSDAKTLFPVFDRYFKEFEKTELLIPACTHFPLIYKEIESYFNQSLKVLHTPKIIAETVRDLLQKQDLLSTVGERELDEYHLSDLTDDFKREAEMFLGRRIELKQTLLNQG
jgi:glutamate racemase